MRLLFVCLGNICRSPAAEGILRQLRPDLEVDSAGLGDWHAGDPPYGPMQDAAKARGYDLSDLRARPFALHDFDDFDVIFAMDGQNLADIEQKRPAGNKTPVRMFADVPVPDPYYTRDFETCLDIIEEAAKKFMPGTTAPPAA